MSPDKTMDDVSKIPITYGNDVRLTKVMVEMVRADCPNCGSSLMNMPVEWANPVPTIEPFPPKNQPSARALRFRVKCMSCDREYSVQIAQDPMEIGKVLTDPKA